MGNDPPDEKKDEKKNNTVLEKKHEPAPDLKKVKTALEKKEETERDLKKDEKKVETALEKKNETGPDMKKDEKKDETVLEKKDETERDLKKDETKDETSLGTDETGGFNLKVQHDDRARNKQAGQVNIDVKVKVVQPNDGNEMESESESKQSTAGPFHTVVSKKGTTSPDAKLTRDSKEYNSAKDKVAKAPPKTADATKGAAATKTETPGTELPKVKLADKDGKGKEKK